MESPFMNIEELAEFLRKPVSYIQTCLKRYPDKIPPRFSKPGETHTWHREDVQAWVTKRRKESQALALSQRQRAGSIRSTVSRSTCAQ